MRERKGLGSPVPDSAPVVAPTAARPRTTAIAESVPDGGRGVLCLVVGARSWPLIGTRLLIGRAGGDADVEVEDASLSRRHAELVATGATWVVRDLGSTNGTWVVDRKLAPGEAVSVTSDVAMRFGSVGADIRRR